MPFRDQYQIPRVFDPDDDPSNWGVETVPQADGQDLVRIKLGSAAPFEIPADEAVKLAALLLKKAGCNVIIKGKMITAIYQGISVNLQ